MGQRLWKITNSDEFGDYDLIDFLEKHGAVFDSKPVLDVPPKAVMAALKNAKALGLDENTINVLKADLEDGDRYDVG